MFASLEHMLLLLVDIIKSILLQYSLALRAGKH